MNREEAIKILTSEIYSDEIAECGVKFKEAFDLAICALNEIDKTVEVLGAIIRIQVALENELKAEKHNKKVMLKRIRAEIEQNAYPIVHGVNNHELGMTLYGILQVIDKYKAESEKEVIEKIPIA